MTNLWETKTSKWPSCSTKFHFRLRNSRNKKMHPNWLILWKSPYFQNYSPKFAKKRSKLLTRNLKIFSKLLVARAKKFAKLLLRKHLFQLQLAMIALEMWTCLTLRKLMKNRRDWFANLVFSKMPLPGPSLGASNNLYLQQTAHLPINLKMISQLRKETLPSILNLSLQRCWNLQKIWKLKVM